ncbi:hypothetical protein FSP39_012254 [Pinctada imbricata]|uniref:Capsid protein n=1 Tax=Pinctada imbricata TaxID=66713 RepID=A0AA89C5S9_PINIB|nr:hypothetical protein FSP39_012254 [Pinctada imbricata]
MEYIDMRRSQMYVKCRLHKSEISSSDNVGLINLPLQALFSQVDVGVQNKQISSTAGHYPFKAYIQCLLRYNKEAKKSQLTSQLWIRDTAGSYDDADVQTGANIGLYERAKYFSKGRRVDLQGPIYHDLFGLDRYIINQVGLTLKFHRSKPEFYLMTNEVSTSYAIEIEELVIKICKVQLNPAVIYAHAQILESTNAKYPFTKTEVKMMAIPRGQVNFTWDNCINGVRLLRCVLGFVNSLAVSGAYNLCPWHFQHYDLSQITLSLDGLPVGGNPLRLNFDDVNGITTVPALVNLMETTGKWMSDSGNGIDRDDISTGTALYAFDIEPQFHTDHYLSLLKYGNLRIDCQFNKPLPEAVTCVLYVETPGYFEINKARDVVHQG